MYPEGRERDSDDPGRLRSDEDHEPEPRPGCDICGMPLHWTMRHGLGPVRIVSVGEFCSDACANQGCLKHEAAMSKRTA